MKFLTSWLHEISESKTNYWMTYVVDLSLMTFFVAWDATALQVGAGIIAVLFCAGVFAWTLTEYMFHRWVYHLGFAITRDGHEKHHQNPTGYVAMPWFITSMLFVPPHLIIAWWFGVRGFSSVLGGWFFGFVAYGLIHHSLHHYKLPFAWFKHLQSEHRIHHALPETNFGVTMRFWDKVFGTQFKKAPR